MPHFEIFDQNTEKLMFICGDRAMFTHLYQFILQKIKIFPRMTAYGLLLLLCVSCSQRSSSPNVELNINEVKATSRPGVYNVAGSTNLPDDSQIVVTAVRYLRSAQERSLNPNSSTNTYSILARQSVPVSAGKWQTTLSFWQVAPDGRFQEAWQMEATLQNSLQPATTVSFIATYKPSSQLTATQQQIPELQGRLVRFSNDGEEYVQASQTLPIALASGKTTPPSIQPEDINGGWGNRAELRVNNPSSTTRPKVIRTIQSNAPLSRSEYLR
ncbi:hypothetical protein [Gloeocapsa sp. PCC 7428]|uniref:hypothetical protein n=1 Tax=Gloeocapsa sp. PCC 7428 TaxID=1173026 RepID=UPI0012DD90C2|nr:hypothetical protein [Gloeocapsa sp. PCC 7428]